jgi:uncharacterized membrane protein YidH (DUF202 family)
MTIAGVPLDPDEGAAGARTDLAWGRTGLSMLAILGSLLRGVLATRTVAQVAAIAIALSGAAVWAVGLRHARQLAGTTARGRHVAEQRTLTLITAGTLVIAAAGALLPLFPG